MAKNMQQKESPQLTGSFSLKSFSDFINANFSLIILLIMAFVSGFLVGSLWKENQLLKSGGNNLAQVNNQDPEAEAQAATKLLEKVPAFDAKNDHFRGNEKAKVVFIEYSDYECPYCNKFHPTMIELMKKYPNDIAWVYRHFPLSFHPNAQPLAEASECVAKYASNEAFWKFSDSVYEKMADGSIYGTDLESKKVSEETILTLAVAAGANRNQVKTCLDNDEMAKAVKDDMTGGSNAGITGTPGTIIISQKGGFELIPGALDLASVETMLAKHL